MGDFFDRFSVKFRPVLVIPTGAQSVRCNSLKDVATGVKQLLGGEFKAESSASYAVQKDFIYFVTVAGSLHFRLRPTAEVSKGTGICPVRGDLS